MDSKEPNLGRALEEMGPNELTDFADELVIEGFERIEDAGETDEWRGMGSFRDALTKFLEGRNIAFIGGLAVRGYLRIRPTQDYDIMIEPSGLSDVHRFLESQAGELRDSVEDTYHYVIAPIRLDVDVRVARSSLDREALQQARNATFQGRRLKIVRPDHLAAMKLKAWSERRDQPEGAQDRQDILGLIRARATSEIEVRDVLTRHRPDLVPRLDEMLQS